MYFHRSHWRLRNAVLSLLAALFCCAGNAHAELKLAQLFSDHMVMQRDIPVPVWGWADPGEEITVAIDGQSKTAKANEAGKWMVRLDPMKVGEPRSMKVSGKSNSLEVNDILLGEVWVCGGQSNMEWTVGNSKDGAKESADANNPQIRFFQAGNGPSPAQLMEKMDPKEYSATGNGAEIYCMWKPCTPESTKTFSAVAYYFARSLHQDLKVPIGLISNSVGATPIETWMSRDILSSDPELKLVLEYWGKLDAHAETPEGKEQLQKVYATFDEREAAARKTGKHIWREGGYRHPLKRNEHATAMFNARVYPLLPYAIRGVIWYQGEANTSVAQEYRKMFPALIQDWRNQWGQGDIPFLFVQLAGWGGPPPASPVDNTWAELREAQALALKMKNTAMAVTIDIGDPANMHAPNKQDVGARLALAARARVYGEDIIFSGPVFKDFKVEGDKIRISFDSVGGGLLAREGPLRSFAVAGEDRKFVWATAEIQGDTVVVFSEQVKQPVAVRYGWHNNPECNLANAELLPASPFRTDTWPGITDNKGYKSRLSKPIAIEAPKVR